jgi:predicted RNase H-like nuclease
MLVVGVDGCPGGWIAVVWDTDRNEWSPRHFGDIEQLLDSTSEAACIGIDIPIGLRDDEAARQCDVEARRVLGWPRMTSVFPAPQRRLLECASYSEASALSQEHFRKGISRQAFGIFKKVHEVDQAMTPDLQQHVIEVHPELAFYAMNDNQPLLHSKKKLDGFAERRDLLRRHVSPSIPDTRADARTLAPKAGADDLLDALAAAWTARRFAECRAQRVAGEPERDERGLRMEIVY